MILSQHQNSLLPLIESHLERFIESQDFSHSQHLKQMIRYQMGWEDQGLRGKRVRPFLVLLTAKAFGGDIEKAMPAALSVEFLHNFTLIHDDIEDQSLVRHNRPTLWKRWGIAQAINAGDALFCLAQLAMLDLAKTCGASIAVQAAKRLNQTCLHLTRGQHMDIAFETDDSITPQAYLDMIAGKTGALLALCTALGGLTADQDAQKVKLLSEFGSSLGMAFQIRDDILGILGDPVKTGKSVSSDLLTRKKTLPILFGLTQSQVFSNMWQMEGLGEDQIRQMAALLEECGARPFANQYAENYTNHAFEVLGNLFPQPAELNAEAKALFELSNELLKREI